MGHLRLVGFVYGEQHASLKTYPAHDLSSAPYAMSRSDVGQLGSLAPMKHWTGQPGRSNAVCFSGPRE